MWNKEWETDPRLFHRWLGECVGAMQTCYAKLDKPGVLDALAKIRQFRPAIKADPYLASLESAEIAASLQMAQCGLDFLNWDDALTNLVLAHKMLETKASRIAITGGEERPESENWWVLLTTLADLCWKAPRTINCEIITVEQALAKRDLIVARVKDHLAKYPRNDDWRNDAIAQGLQWLDTKLCAWVWRARPDLYPETRDAADARAPGVLSDRSQPYYWDLTLALGWLGGGLSARALRNIAHNRRAVMRRAVPVGIPLEAYDVATDNELRYLLNSATLRLEVMAGA